MGMLNRVLVLKMLLKTLAIVFEMFEGAGRRESFECLSPNVVIVVRLP